ncbi:hypothetical protein [Streptomyces sp. NPDC051211]|uniref:hypothetical protein n=1 Tax=Streptomyces sp. NPDC051211 TaxID=3154643 RepID=UPI00344D230C
MAVLARRRDLQALLDRHVPLGPHQAARRLGVRHVDFDAAVRLGFVSPVGSVEIDYRRQGGVTVVPLYSAEEVALPPCPPLGRNDNPLWLEVYRLGTDKEGNAPCFLVVLSNSGYYEVLYAESAPALMDSSRDGRRRSRRLP